MAPMNEHILLPALGVFERDLLEPPVCDTAKQQTPLISVGATPGPLLPAGSMRDSTRVFFSMEMSSFCLGNQAALLHQASLAGCICILLLSAQVYIGRMLACLSLLSKAD